MAFDGRAFGKEIVEIVRDYLERQLSPLEERISALEEAQAGVTKASKPTVRVKVAGRPQ
ncbi:hypothetical protein ACLJYM_02280 [Rhizobium giardinii]|uniref:hypothetical protein n=1 Tax=Rhizobium giardinii TaxID=56731 RepID=UPI0039E12D52